MNIDENFLKEEMQKLLAERDQADRVLQSAAQQKMALNGALNFAQSLLDKLKANDQS